IIQGIDYRLPYLLLFTSRHRWSFGGPRSTLRARTTFTGLGLASGGSHTVVNRFALLRLLELLLLELKSGLPAAASADAAEVKYYRGNDDSEYESDDGTDQSDVG
ncbi:hypothetical protein PENTCL1PPCAC_7798, partial [Pristionchus entomophagus]